MTRTSRKRSARHLQGGAAQRHLDRIDALLAASKTAESADGIDEKDEDQ